MFTCLAVYGVHHAFILFSMKLNGLAGSNIVGKLMRCVAQFVMIIRFMLCSHTFESHHIYFILHKKQQQQLRQKTVKIV